MRKKTKDTIASAFLMLVLLGLALRILAWALIIVLIWYVLRGLWNLRLL